MISKVLVKKKSEELNIPFSNLLTGAVCETIIEILTNGHYCNELYLNNPMDFSAESYKRGTVQNIYYEFSRDLDEKMSVLYLRDIHKDIISRAALEGFVINGTVEDMAIKLSITVDEMYVPVTLHFAKKKQTADGGEILSLPLTMYDNREIKYLANPKEELVVSHLCEIIEKLELINDMDHYFELYDIITQYPINGRKLKDRLDAKLKEKGISISDNQIEIISGYRNYTYMKKKWKVELRQKKTSSPEWQDVIDCLIKFLNPIWDAMNRNIVFLGDWMPQIKRYLD